MTRLIALFALLLAASSSRAQAIAGYTTACQPGCSITITGTGFGATQGSSFVSFNGITATVTTWSDTSLAVTVPSGAQTGPLFVTVNNVASNKVNFIVTDDVSQPLVNRGADPQIAIASASAIEGVLANAKAEDARISLVSNQQTVDETKEANDIAAVNANISVIANKQTVDEAKEAVDIASVNAKIAAIPAGPPGPPGTVSPWIGVDSVTSYKHADTVNPAFATGVPGISDTTFIFIRAGDYLDFIVNVPAGGNAFAVALSSGAGGGTFHLEMPAGTMIGATTPAPNTQNWYTYTTVVVPVSLLPSGTVTVRWVCDTPGQNVAGIKAAKR